MEFETVSLKSVCTFLDNQRVPITDADRKPGPYPYYGANGQQDSIHDYIFDEPLVLLAEDGGHFGSKTRPIAYKVSGKCWVNNHAHVLRPKEICDVDYLHRVLSFYDVSQYITGSTRAKLTKSKAEEIKIPLPPLLEQKRIAAVLAKADRLRRLRRYGLELADTYLQPVFLEMFGDPAKNPKGWLETTIFSIATKVTDGEHATPQRTESGIKLLSARNIQNGYIDFNAELDYIPQYEYERIRKRCNPEIGDVLMSCSGTIGRVATVQTLEPLSMVRSVALIKPNHTRINSRFLEHFLRTQHSQRLINQSANKSSQANIFISPIKELPVFVPPLDLQQKFAHIVQKFERLRVQGLEAQRQAEALFGALLHRAFTGELTGAGLEVVK